MEEEKVRITMVGCQVIQGGRIGTIIFNGNMVSYNDEEHDDAAHGTQEAFDGAGGKSVKGFMTRGDAELQRMKTFMESEGLMAEGMKQAEFNRIFTGREVTERIVWTGKQKVLAAFVKEGVDSGALKAEGAIWDVATGCFTLKGEEIKPNNLKSKTKVSDERGKNGEMSERALVNTMLSYI